MYFFKRYARSFVRMFGYDIVNYSRSADSRAILYRALQSHKVDFVIDIGANMGQYGKYLRSVGYKGAIVSVEPMKVEQKMLVNLAGSDANWVVVPPMAIGGHDGLVEFNIAANSGSSSLLEMLDVHKNAAPESAYIGKEIVSIYKLDTFSDQFVDKSFKSLFLKIDVQGAEWSVLDGGQETLKRVVGIMCECSFTPLYAGEAPWLDLIQRIEGMGFNIWGFYPGFSDRKTGKLLQADVLFFRDNELLG